MRASIYMCQAPGRCVDDTGHSSCSAGIVPWSTPSVGVFLMLANVWTGFFGMKDDDAFCLNAQQCKIKQCIISR